MDPGETVLREMQRFASSRELLWNLTLRELRTKYRRSFLGWTWSLLNPLSLVLTYGFVFGVVFGATAPVGSPSGLNNYALYLLSGLLPWAFFNLVTSLGLGTLIANAGLIRKVAFSRETLVFAQSLFSLVQFSIEISVLTVILTVFGGRPLVWLPVTVVMMVLLCIFATGVGLVLATIAVYFRDLLHLWGIVLQVYFYTVPVIWNMDTMKERVTPLQLDFLTWNPMAVFVRSFRHTLYDGRNPGAGQVFYMLVAALISISGGFFVFNRFGRRIAEEL